MDKVKNMIKADLYRYFGSESIADFFKAYFLIPGFRYMFWFRITKNYKSKNKLFYILLLLKLRRLQYKFGFDIPTGTSIERGFYLGHFGGIVISPMVKIGKNCNISQNVTIGYNSRGSNKGYPVIKENVYIGPGAIVIGDITIGNNVAIGANAVVTHDVPDNSVVVGIPAKVISMKGSEGYILNKIE
jgi:serine O-acetyltransferase